MIEDSSDLTSSEAASYATLARMAERVASLEARYQALKEDTQVIRSSIHSINQELQKMVISEESRRSSLAQLTIQVGLLVQASPAIAAAVQTFDGMRADLKTVIEDRQRSEGRRSIAHEGLAFMRGVLPWLIALAGLGLWISENVRVHGGL